MIFGGNGGAVMYNLAGKRDAETNAAMNQNRREEAANVTLATCLSELLGGRFMVIPEDTGRADGKLADITLRYGGLEIFLETKHDNFDAAVKAACNRWNVAKPPDVVGAVSYSPPYLCDFENAVRQGATIDFALSGNKNDDLAARKRTGGIYDLAQSLRRPHSIIAPHEDDDIDKAIANIRGMLALFCQQMKLAHPGTLYRLAKLLQADFNSGDKEEEVMKQTALMTGLVLFGAMLFQTALADKNPTVSKPRDKLKDKTGIPALRAHWREIVDKINYAAIFNIAADILDKGIHYKAVDAIMTAAEQVQHIAKDGVDLMGRVYHELLTGAKSLGAFYTSIPSATLMAGLALNPADWQNTDWTDAAKVGELRIADPACGSGTLLAAASWKVLDNFSRAHFQKYGGGFGGEKKTHPRAHLQRLLIENVVWGYDILETAAHLSAAALGMMSPETDFRKAHIYRAIIGDAKDGTAAGSLELLESNMPIYRRNEHIEKADVEPLPPLDVCIMNPPFVRGQKGHESFGFLTPGEQRNVQERVRKLGKKHNFINDKGQGAGFVALACLQRMQTAFIKEGGKLAAILPATAAVGMGKAWSGARAKIEKDFDLETIIVSREKGSPNFSESTALQECMFVAKKRTKGEKPQKTAMFIVLKKKPATVGDAHATVQAILRAKKSNKVFGNLYYNDPPDSAAEPAGQFALLPWHNKNAWRGISFVSLQLAFAAETFSQEGTLHPYAKGKMPVCKLGNIATFGGSTIHLQINHKQFHSANIVGHKTQYAGYYPGYHKIKSGIAHKDETGIVEKPHCYLMPVAGREKWADNFFAKAGRVVLNESFTFTAVRRLAVLVSEPVQASHYWPVTLNNENEDKLKTLTLWLNSTPALLLIAHASSSTKETKVTFSQKAAAELMAPDMDKLPAAKLAKAAAAFDDIAKGPGLSPLPKMANDNVRAEIDKVFSDMFDFGDLSPLREALAAEPIISGA